MKSHYSTRDAGSPHGGDRCCCFRPWHRRLTPFQAFLYETKGLVWWIQEGGLSSRDAYCHALNPSTNHSMRRFLSALMTIDPDTYGMQSRLMAVALSCHTPIQINDELISSAVQYAARTFTRDARSVTEEVTTEKVAWACVAIMLELFNYDREQLKRSEMAALGLNNVVNIYLLDPAQSYGRNTAITRAAVRKRWCLWWSSYMLDNPGLFSDSAFENQYCVNMAAAIDCGEMQRVAHTNRRLIWRNKADGKDVSDMWRIYRGRFRIRPIAYTISDDDMWRIYTDVRKRGSVGRPKHLPPPPPLRDSS